MHAIVSSATERVTREGVRRALRSALERVLSWQIAEIAIPPLGLGAGNLDIDESAELMADELARHLATAAFPEASDAHRRDAGRSARAGGRDRAARRA